MISPQVKIEQYDFESSLFDEFNTNHFAKDLWPLVYILSDGDTKTAYVGETTDAYARMSTHLKHKNKSKLTSVHLITSDKYSLTFASSCIGKLELVPMVSNDKKNFIAKGITR